MNSVKLVCSLVAFIGISSAFATEKRSLPSLQVSQANAQETTKTVFWEDEFWHARVIRPSHLLAVEIAGVLEKDMILAGVYGDAGARLAYGLAPKIEARVDVSDITQINTGTQQNLAATLKYHLYGERKFGVSILGTLGEANSLGNGPYITFGAQLPITLSTAPMLITIVPFLNSTSSSTSTTNVGSNIGIGSFLDPHFAVIGEGTLNVSGGTVSTGYKVGVAVCPTKEITIPIVLVSKAPTDQNASIGLLAFFAFVGFQL